MDITRHRFAELITLKAADHGIAIPAEVAGEIAKAFIDEILLSLDTSDPVMFRALDQALSAGGLMQLRKSKPKP